MSDDYGDSDYEMGSEPAYSSGDEGYAYSEDEAEEASPVAKLPQASAMGAPQPVITAPRPPRHPPARSAVSRRVLGTLAAAAGARPATTPCAWSGVS